MNRKVYMFLLLALITCLTACNNGEARDAVDMPTQPSEVVTQEPEVQTALDVPKEAQAPADALGQGYATPDEAVEAFFTYLAQGDLDGAISTYAVDEMAEGFDFVLYCERIGVVRPLDSPDPGQNEFSVELRRAEYYGDTAAKIETFMRVMVLQLSEDKLNFDASAYEIEDFPYPLEEYIGLFNYDPAGLELVQLAQPKPDATETEQYKQMLKERAAVYGGEDMVNRAFLIRYEGEYFCGIFQLIEYDGTWRLMDQSGAFFNFLANIPVALISGVEEFAELCE